MRSVNSMGIRRCGSIMLRDAWRVDCGRAVRGVGGEEGFLVLEEDSSSSSSPSFRVNSTSMALLSDRIVFVVG